MERGRWPLIASLSVHACLLSGFSHVWLCYPMGCSPPGLSIYGVLPRQEYWNELPCPPPGGLLNLGIEPMSPALQTDSLLLSHQGSQCTHIWQRNKVGMGSLFLLVCMLTKTSLSYWSALGLKRRWPRAIESLITQPMKVQLAAGLVGLFLEHQLESDTKEVTSQPFRGRRPGGPKSEAAAWCRSQQGASWQRRKAKSSDSNHGFRSLGEGRPGKGLALLLCVQILSLIFWAAGWGRMEYLCNTAQLCSLCF